MDLTCLEESGSAEPPRVLGCLLVACQANEIKSVPGFLIHFFNPSVSSPYLSSPTCFIPPGGWNCGLSVQLPRRKGSERCLWQDTGGKPQSEVAALESRWGEAGRGRAILSFTRGTLGKKTPSGTARGLRLGWWGSVTDYPLRLPSKSGWLTRPYTILAVPETLSLL